MSPRRPGDSEETGVRAWFMDLIERYIFRIAFSAFVGILVSYLLGDVPAAVLGFGTASSAATGAIGGLIGKVLSARAAQRA